MFIAYLISGFGVAGVVYLLVGVEIIYQYQGGVKYRWGRLIKDLSPGLHFAFPGLERIKKYNLRVLTLEVPKQSTISQDNIPLEVNAVVNFKVRDPSTVATRVENFKYAVSELSQVAVLNLVGANELNTLLSERKKVANQIQQWLMDEVQDWGIEIKGVAIRDIEIPKDMKKAIAAQAEAERKKKAQVIRAQAEIESNQKLNQAAQQLGSDSTSLQLRLYQTLREIASQSKTNTVFPIPMELLQTFSQQMKQEDSHQNGGE